MVPTHDDVFSYLTSRMKLGEDVHGRDSAKLAAEFACALSHPPTHTDAQLVAFSQWADEWKELTPVGCC